METSTLTKTAEKLISIVTSNGQTIISSKIVGNTYQLIMHNGDTITIFPSGSFSLDRNTH